MRQRCVLLAILALLAAAPCGAQQWAKEMFAKTSHDFGVIARGAKAEFRFTLENIYEEDVHVTDVHSSCGCTKPTITRQLLKTWEKADVVATIDTRGFMGRKEATVTVTLDKPFPAEVLLHVYCYIRSDVVVEPEAIRFGTVAQTAGDERHVRVKYAGRDDWRIERIESRNPNIEARAIPGPRSPGLAAYDVAVKLKPGAPAGYLQEQLVIVTNDPGPRSSRIPVTVEGTVVGSGLTVQPAPLSLGAVDAGQSVSKMLTVHGQSPFHVLGVQASDKRLECSVLQKTETLCLIPVKFTAGATAERVTGTIRIQTDTGGTLEAAVDGQVVVPH